jgi:hypothetical protein
MSKTRMRNILSGTSMLPNYHYRYHLRLFSFVPILVSTIFITAAIVNVFNIRKGLFRSGKLWFDGIA